MISLFLNQFDLQNIKIFYGKWKIFQEYVYEK